MNERMNECVKEMNDWMDEWMTECVKEMDDWTDENHMNGKDMKWN